MRRAVVVAICLSLTVALAVLAWRQHEVRSAQESAQRDARSVLELSRQQVLDLTTLSPGSIDVTLERMVARTSGDFKRQLEALLATFAEVVSTGDLTTTGAVDSAGVRTLSGTRATVLVAATATVRSKTHAQPATRSYRFEVGLRRRSAEWLISSMEFVK